MGITGLIPFLEKASRKANIGEFSGCTVAIDSYCWLHKGAFACADKLVRGEDTDIHIKYCLKYVTMLLSKNIKPILVFDGRHLPAKAMTESKRRESRMISKKRAAELLSLGKIEEARSYMRRSVDITHAMALQLIKECRNRNVDCIVAPYEADAQLAYLNMKNIAQLVITEDSDLILFGCTKVLFKMDLDGAGTLVEKSKLPLVMGCPVERYSFGKFRQMCIMSGCDYLASLPGIGLAKARQFVTATQDPNFANALRKLPSFFNKSSLAVSDEYRESFLKAEATFRHQYVYDPLERRMVRLTDPDDEDVEKALCVNAGELLDPKIAFELAVGNLDPFTLKKMDDWHPDDHVVNRHVKTENWKDKGVSKHPSIWGGDFGPYLAEACPWAKKAKPPEPIIAAPQTRPRKKVVNLVAKYVPETQDESITIESLSNMYCSEPMAKKQKVEYNDDSEISTQCNTQLSHNIALCDDEITTHLNTQNDKSPILENKERSFKKCLRNGGSNILKRLSRFPRTTIDDNIVESKFFNSAQSTSEHNTSKESIVIEESPERISKNPFKVKSVDVINKDVELKIETDLAESQLSSSQKENSPQNSPRKSKSPVFERSVWNKAIKEDNPVFDVCTEDSVIDNTYPYETLVTPVDSQSSFGSPPLKSKLTGGHLRPMLSQPNRTNKSTALKRSTSLPTNQPTLLSKFGFQRKPVLKR